MNPHAPLPGVTKKVEKCSTAVSTKPITDAARRNRACLSTQPPTAFRSVRTVRGRLVDGLFFSILFMRISRIIH
jgi:hypothetical protein